jgi:hypothetical protein
MEHPVLGVDPATLLRKGPGGGVLTKIITSAMSACPAGAKITIFAQK